MATTKPPKQTGRFQGSRDKSEEASSGGRRMVTTAEPIGGDVDSSVTSKVVFEFYQRIPNIAAIIAANASTRKNATHFSHGAREIPSAGGVSGAGARDAALALASRLAYASVSRCFPARSAIRMVPA